MMIKCSTFKGTADNGEPLVKLFRQGDSIEKTAGEFMPAVKDWLGTYKSDRDNVAVLINAMGASEYYGQNCFPAGTLVLRGDGSQAPIEELEVGDEVVTHTGEVHNVSQTFCYMDTKGLLGVRPQGHPRHLWSTPGHPYYVVKRDDALRLKRHHVYNRKALSSEPLSLEEALQEFCLALRPEWLPAEELEKGDLVFLKIDTNEEIDEDLNAPGMATLLGWYTAEGCIGRRRRKDVKGTPWEEHLVIFTLGSQEADVADRLVNLLKARGLSPKRVDMYQGHNTIRIEAYSQVLARICKKHAGKGSHHKTLSSAVMRMPRSWQKEFLEAYISGDGCVIKEGSKGAGSVRISTASSNLSVDVRMMLARLGFVSSVIPGHQHHTSLGAGNEIYEISVPAGQFGDVVSKVSGVVHPHGYLVCPVADIQEDPAWQGTVYNIEVEVDNSYVADRVVVHNSNADIFYEKALLHDCRHHPSEQHRVDDFTGKIIPPYGYWTFLQALPFVHHRNNDPTRAFGKVPIATWNPRMHRVELVAVLNRDQALQFDAGYVIEKIDAGQCPAVSMGCRVPWDRCFPAGTLIITESGYRPIEVVREGDLVLTHEGRPRKVVATVVSPHKGTMVSLGVWGSPRGATQTYNHPIEVVREEKLRNCRGSSNGSKRRHSPDKDGICRTCHSPVDLTREWVEAEDVHVGDYLVQPIQNTFSARSAVTASLSSEMAYLFGLYLGDGHIIRQRSGRGKTGEYRSVGVGFTLGDDHPEVLENFLSKCQELYDRKELKNLPKLYEQKGKHAQTANLYGVELASVFESLGGRGCKDKFVHTEVFSWSSEARLAVLGGLIDSDGCQDKNGAIRVVGINEALLMGAQRLCFSVDILGSISTYIASSSDFSGPHDVFQLSIPGSASTKLSEASAKTKPVARSVGSAALIVGDRVFLPVQTKEVYEDSLDVYNLQVEEDESYVANGISVHNCTICGHRSRTRKDYCACITEFGLGKTLEDGRRIGVINDYPRFFDISFVFIGADKTAYSMAKLGSAGVMSSAELGEMAYQYNCGTSSCQECSSGCRGTLQKVAEYMSPEELKKFKRKQHEIDNSPLLLGKADTQESASSVGDGVLRTTLGEDAQMKLSSPRSLTDVYAKVRDLKIGPPPSPNRKDFPFVGSLKFQGLDIWVENAPGTWRTGKGWKTLMHVPYGEFPRAKGTDGDKLDVYVGPFSDASEVYVVHQNNPKTGQYDEDKVMLGFESAEQAKAVYLGHYNDPKFFRSLTIMPFQVFKKMVQTGEADGQKVATELQKVAMDLRLEDLFGGAAQASRRERRWTHHDGKETKVTGSGLGSFDMAKAASGVIKEAGFFGDFFGTSEQTDARKEYIRHNNAFADHFNRHIKEKMGGKGVTEKQYVKIYDAWKPQYVAKYKPKFDVDLAYDFRGHRKTASAGITPLDLLKLADTKTADHSKWADIVKDVGPDKAVGQASSVLSSAETTLPPEVMAEMEKKPLEESLATPSAMGMVLKPEEFQHLVLSHHGHHSLADSLQDAGLVFGDTGDEMAPCGELSPRHMDMAILRLLLPFLAGRSYLGPVVQRRIIQISVKKPEPQESSVSSDLPLLSKVGAAYNWYRREMLKMATHAQDLVPRIPELNAAVHGISDSDFFKMSSVPETTIGKAMLVGSVPLALMYSSHLQGRQRSGERLGPIDEFVAGHPWISSAGALVGMREALKHPKVQSTLGEFTKALAAKA